MHGRKEFSSGRHLAPLARALLLLLVLGTGCEGGLFHREPPPPPLQPGEARPAFWRVSGPTGATLYLLGSIHFGPATGWRYPIPIEEAYEASNALMVEMDLERLSPEIYRSLLMRYGLLPGPLSLQAEADPRVRSDFLAQA